MVLKTCTSPKIGRELQHPHSECDDEGGKRPKLETDEHVPQAQSAMILSVRLQLTVLLPSTSPVSPSAALISSMSTSA